MKTVTVNRKPTEELVIRFIKPEDVESLMTFFTKQRDYPKTPKDANLDYDETEIKEYIKSTHDHIVVSKIGKNVTGYAVVYDLTTWGYIDELCINKNFRGMGIGTKMFNWIENQYKDKWYSVEMAAYEEDTEMVDYLHKLGYGKDEKLVWMFKGLKK